MGQLSYADVNINKLKSILTAMYWLIIIFMLIGDCYAEKCDYKLLSMRNYGIPVDQWFHPDTNWNYLGVYSDYYEADAIAFSAGYPYRYVSFTFQTPDQVWWRFYAWMEQPHNNFNKCYIYVPYYGQCPPLPDEDGDGIQDTEDLDFIKPAEKNLGIDFNHPEGTCNQVVN